MIRSSSCMLIVLLTAQTVAACAPDDPLEHPCMEGSTIYNECEQVEIGGSCSDTSQCTWSKGNGECNDGVCVCEPDCAEMICGEDGCGGDCGECSAGGSCENGQCAYPYWTDPTSNLTWENPPEGAKQDWASAKEYCVDLELDGGGWRLPTVSELRSLIRECAGQVTGGACGVTDTCLSYSQCWSQESCWSCLTAGCYWPDELQGPCDWYWSSSEVEDIYGRVWYVGFDDGYLYYYTVHGDGNVRCVR